MEELKISKENAVLAYEAANDKGKTLLSNLFGKKTFIKNVTERINSFEDACKYQGLDPDERLRYPANTTDPGEISENGYTKLITVFKSLNEGVTLTINDTRYFPWHKPHPSGVGLAFGGNGFGSSSTTVGVPLTLKTRELAIFVGNHPKFTEYYNEYNNA